MSKLLRHFLRKTQEKQKWLENQHAIDWLIDQVKQRDPEQEEKVVNFLHEWMHVIEKVPPLDFYEIEQSVRFVWENKHEMYSSPSGKSYKYIIKGEEIIGFIQKLLSGTRKEMEDERKAKNKIKRMRKKK